MSYLAIDPGVDTGWAFFTSATGLVACGVGNPRVCEGARTVIIEKPQIYASRLMKGDPNNIITLAIGVGRYLEYFEAKGARVAMVSPSTWKGQVPKEIHHARVLAGLTEQDKAVILAGTREVAVSRRHNAIDAVALGLAAFRMRLWAL